MTDQSKRNKVSPDDAVFDDPVTNEPVTGDGEIVKKAKTEFHHGVLGCCSNPDYPHVAICCAIFLDAYVCPCCVFGGMWRASSEEQRLCKDFCYPCCGFLFGLPFAPCMLGFLRSKYRTGFRPYSI